MRIREVVEKRTEGLEPANFSGSAALLGPDNVLSPVGSVPKNQQVNTKRHKGRLKWKNSSKQ